MTWRKGPKDPYLHSLTKTLYETRRFYEEAEIWKKLKTTSFNSKRSIPKLFGTKVVSTKDGKKFGIIVTELGVPVNAIFKNLTEPKTRLVKEDQFESFFKSFRKTAYYTGEF